MLKQGVVDASRADEIVPRINIDLSGKSRLTKSELMVIEMLKENNWERPMYFAVTVGDDYYLGLNDHFELTGLAYQIMPLSTEGNGAGVNTAEMYDNMMHKFRYGNIADPGVYLDENTMRMCRTHRMMFSQLVNALIEENDTVRPKSTGLFWKPFLQVPYDMILSIPLVESYLELHAFEEGSEILM